MTRAELEHVTRNYLRGCNCRVCAKYARLEAQK